MIWGENVRGPDKVSIHAERGSTERILAVLGRFYPGSWLPYGEESVARVAAPYFCVLSLNNGRRDYIHTMDQWRVISKFSFRKLAPALKLPAPSLPPDSGHACSVQSQALPCFRATSPVGQADSNAGCQTSGLDWNSF